MATKELTIQVDETTHAAFDKLCKGAGLSESAMFRVIVNKQADTREENAVDVPAEQPAKKPLTLREILEGKGRATFDPTAFGRALDEMRQISAENGNCNMTLDEINAEIALSRKARDERKILLAELRAKTPWIDKSGLREIDDMFSDEVKMELEEYRKMGYEVNING